MDDEIITCSDCGFEFERHTSIGSEDQLFCPECGTDCLDDD